MTDEQLIEEAKKAILDNFHAPDDRHPSWWINPEEMARAVLAVFEERWSHTQSVNVDRVEWERLKAAEKAHTPTDDEREALETAICGCSRWLPWFRSNPVWGHAEPQGEPSSEVEPSAEEVDLREQAVAFGWDGSMDDYAAMRSWLFKGVRRLEAAMNSLGECSFCGTESDNLTTGSDGKTFACPDCLGSADA